MATRSENASKVIADLNMQIRALQANNHQLSQKLLMLENDKRPPEQITPGDHLKISKALACSPKAEESSFFSIRWSNFILGFFTFIGASHYSSWQAERVHKDTVEILWWSSILSTGRFSRWQHNNRGYGFDYINRWPVHFSCTMVIISCCYLSLVLSRWSMFFYQYGAQHYCYYLVLWLFTLPIWTDWNRFVLLYKMTYRGRKTAAWW